MNRHSNNRHIGFILRQAPYGNSLAKEALDAVLASATFGQDITVIFMDDGVFQLNNNQGAEAMKQKSFSKILTAFELYDIHKIYACQHSLQSRQLDKKLLSIAVDIVDTDELNQTIRQLDVVLSF